MNTDKQSDSLYLNLDVYSRSSGDVTLTSVQGQLTRIVLSSVHVCRPRLLHSGVYIYTMEYYINSQSRNNDGKPVSAITCDTIDVIFVLCEYVIEFGSLGLRALGIWGEMM